MKPTIKPTIFLLFLTLLAACAPTMAQVIEQYKEPFAQKRKQLIAIAESLPPVGSISENSYCKNMDPLLIVNDGFSEKEPTGSLVMYEQLLDPDVDLWESELFNVSLDDRFIRALKWTGPKDPSDPRSANQRNPKLAKQLSSALALPYLIVNRVAEYTPAQVIDEGSFLPGRVAIEGFVIAMKDNQILCSYRIEATTSAELVQYKITGDSSNPISTPEKALQHALEKDARLSIQKTLTEITGGTIKYDKISLP